ncbi:GGDEF domain-containing protein, partial [Treponema sp. Marseille-Q4523]|uniref:GGDEF domain-containing protein n=1 Tax=Treponema sp. Marseille-Q4523 TaxID=2810610 RepID=UPI001960CF6D
TYLTVIDINKFKAINDRYGHAEGDAALKHTANILRNIAAKHDNIFIARFGGDEFIILSKGERYTNDICAEFKNALTRFNAAHQKPWELSVSLGSAPYKTEYRDFEEWFTQADSEMYKEKKRKTAAAQTHKGTSKNLPSAIFQNCDTARTRHFAYAFSINIRQTSRGYCL